jgi:mannose-6-phosphate isomerase-like protein (cupin superfamily)
MNEQIKIIGGRIRELREITDTPVKTLADVNKISEAEYLSYEGGKKDFSFSFLYNCSLVFKVDIGEIVAGEAPRLKSYTVTRRGGGMPIERREGFNYLHLANHFKDREAEPFLVTAPFRAAEQDKPVPVSQHEGQEMDYILEGALKMSVHGKTEILNAGDFIYYDSSYEHGMIAYGGKKCVFLAIVLKHI